MSRFSQRAFVIVDLEDLTDVGVTIDITSVVLRFANWGTIDLGALCYSIRDHSKRTPNKRSRPVDLDSVTDERRQSVLKLLGVFAAKKSRDGNRYASVYATSVLMERFVRWSDLNGYQTTLNDKQIAERAYAAYSNHLLERVRRHDLKTSTASSEQKAIKALCVQLFEDDDFGSTCRNIIRGQGDGEGTSPPSEDLQGRVLALTHAIFQGFSELVLKELSFPYQLAMPKYLSWEHPHLWVFPLRDWIRPPRLIEEHARSHRGNIAYNYSNGTIYSVAEVRRETTQRRAQRAHKCACRRMTTANTDFRDFSRLHFAVVAHNAFTVIFQSITSMNEAQLNELPWSDDFQIHASRMKFKVIKYRARGKKCKFEISSKSLPIFYQFLALRKYLLGEHQYDGLFLTLGVNNQSPPAPIRAQLHQTFFNCLREFDPTLQTLGTRKWRAAKTDDSIARDENLMVTAQILQNSVSTVEKSYAAGSERTHHEEMTSYFSAMAKTILIKKEEIESTREIANGRCKSQNNPLPQNPPSSITVDCGNTDGCVFCGHFRLHPDRDDIKKLLSARFYIDAIARSTATAEQFEILFAPVLKKIDSLVLTLEKVAGELVKEIKASVRRGQLSEFWKQKITMLQLAGAI